MTNTIKTTTKNNNSHISNENDSDDEGVNNDDLLGYSIQYDEDKEQKDEDKALFEEFCELHGSKTVKELTEELKARGENIPSGLNKIELIVFYMKQSDTQLNWLEKSNFDHVVQRFRKYGDEKKKNFLIHVGKQTVDPIDSFLALFQPVLDIMVTEANRYVEQNNRMEECKKLFPDGITQHVINCFLAVVIIMGSSHIKSIDGVYDISSFMFLHSAASIMTRDQYYFLSSNVHFVDNLNGKISKDRFYKILHLEEIMNKQFKLYYDLAEFVIVDEGIVPTRNRSMGICGYEKDKPDKWGYKVYKSVDEDGYLYHFKIYLGKGSIQKGDYDKVGSAIVASFVKETGIIDHHHTLIVNNYFSSINLFKELYDMGIYSIGTFRRKVTAIPPQLLEKDLLKYKGDYKKLFLKDCAISMMKYKDSDEFFFIDSKYGGDLTGKYISKNEERQNEEPRNIPLGLKEYKEKMGKVDLHDREVKDGAFYGHNKKWYFSFFYFILESAIINSFNIHKKYVGLKIEKDTYKQSLVESLIGGHSLRSYQVNLGKSPFSNLKNRTRSNSL